MFPEQQLEALAIRERALRLSIGARRWRIGAAMRTISKRLGWIDRVLGFWRARYSFGGIVPPLLGGVALALLARFAPRLARFARVGALVAGPLREVWKITRRPSPRMR